MLEAEQVYSSLSAQGPGQEAAPADVPAREAPPCLFMEPSSDLCCAIPGFIGVHAT